MRFIENAIASIKKVKGNHAGLRRRLLLSHLAIAGVSFSALLILFISILWLRSAATRLAWESAPTAQMSLRVMNGIQQSLASLRGWIMLGESDFKEKRKEAWEKQINPSLKELGQLSSRRIENEGSLKTLLPLTKKLEGLQWWIEDVAQTPGNQPAELMFQEKIRPSSEKIFNSATEWMDEEKTRKGSQESKVMLASLANFSGMLDHAEKRLGDFLRSGNKTDEEEFLKNLTAADEELKGLLDSTQTLPETQKNRLARIEWDFKDFKIHAYEALKIRKKEDWNIAEHRLRTQALPLELQVTQGLNKLLEVNERKMNADSQSAIWVGRLAIFLSILFILAMGFLAIYLSNRSAARITQPILAIAASAQALFPGSQAGENPILEHVDRGELTQAFQSMQFALERSHVELTRSNKDLEQFAYVASHDLQEPLGKITTFVDFLKEKLADKADEESKLYLERMDAAAKRMRQLIKDLLEYSKIQTHPGEFPDVNLGEILSGVLSDLEIRIRQNQAKVEADSLPAVKADSTQMRQLLQNLIGNGLKYRSDKENPRIQIRCSKMPDQKFCQIMIQDNGIGFDQAKAEEIFLPFKRLHGVGGKYEGSGIGLSVCQKIVQRYGGTIRAESSPGQGSKFIFTLPLAAESKIGESYE